MGRHGASGTSIGAPGWAHGVGCLVVLSGAGLSTDSGIPDFRGASGVWTLDPQVEHRHTYPAFLADPQLRRSYWTSRYEHPVWDAEPNPGHRAVTELACSGIDTTVVTQNTDGLHQRAGTPADQVIELHGTMHEVSCVACQHRSPTVDVLARIEAGEAVPQCRRCGGILKTASTMFGQTIDPAVFARAERAVQSCDLVLAVGTTLVIEPAGSLCASAVRAGARLVIVNRDPTPYDSIATETIRDPLGETLPRLARQVLAGTPPADARPGRGVTERTDDPLPGDQLAYLQRAAAEHGLEVPADAAAAAVVTALLCGAADERTACAALGHIPALPDDDTRIRAARWLRRRYPPAGSGQARYWDDSLPGPLAEDLIAATATPRFLMRMLTETTAEQDRRALTVLARAAATRPHLQTGLVELLSVLPGLSPAAVDAALTGGYPAPLARALTSLARNTALPAELLEAVPAGTTALGEFPILLAESLVAAYERRIETHPESARPGLVRARAALAARRADLGRTAAGLAA